MKTWNNICAKQTLFHHLGTKLVPDLIGTKLVLNLVGTKFVPNLVGTNVVPNCVGTKVVPNLVEFCWSKICPKSYCTKM